MSVQQKKEINNLEVTLQLQKKRLDSLRHSIKEKKEQIQIFGIENENLTKCFSVVSSSSTNRRKLNPTSGSLNYRTTVKCHRETIAACNTINAGSEENINPALDGMLDTLNAKLSSEKLALKILSSKISLKNAISRKGADRLKIQYFKSQENFLRSLNV